MRSSSRPKTAAALPIDDFETRGSAADHLDLRLWLRMMALHKLITTEARRRLRTSFGMSLSRFDLMAQLDGRPGELRMGELSRRLMVTTGNITGLTDELVADGFVERVVDPNSRRVYLVRLTASGRKAFRAAAKANEAWMREFFSVLSNKEKELLYEMLGRQKSFMQTRVQGPKPAEKLD